MAARMLNSRSRRLKLIRSTASAMKTPTWKATQNQMFVGTAQTVPCSAPGRNRKGVRPLLLLILIVLMLLRKIAAGDEDHEQDQDQEQDGIEVP